MTSGVEGLRHFVSVLYAWAKRYGPEPSIEPCFLVVPQFLSSSAAAIEPTFGSSHACKVTHKVEEHDWYKGIFQSLG